MIPSKVIEQFVSEGNDYQYSFKYSESFSGNVISFIGYDVDASGTVLATANGTGANVFQVVTLSTNALDVGDYYLEVWKDYSGNNQELIYPPDNVRFRFVIQERYGV